MNRQQHWQKVYETKQSEEVSWFQRVPTVSLGLIQNAGFQPET
jgi:hypothetical protein